jgi:hypothetical protein
MQWIRLGLVSGALGLALGGCADGGADGGDAGEVEGDIGAPGDSDEPGCVAGAGEPTWNDEVGAILAQRCGHCHAATPIGGAPMSLLTYSDATAPVPAGTPSMPARIAMHVGAGTMPPAGQPGLSEDERDAVLSWASGCALEGSGTFVPPELPAQTGEPELPLNAEVHGVYAGGFAVPVVDDLYHCVPMELSLDGPKHVVRFGAEVDQAEVVHHIVLYADPDKLSPDEPYTCTGTPKGSTFMYSWAPGTGAIQFPPGLGLPVADGDRIILQVHYNNGKAISGLTDDSGVRLYLTDPQPNEVAMLVTGPLKFDLPPLSEQIVESQCRLSQDITLIAAMPHMHELGKSFEHTVERASGEWETVASVPVWSFFDQPFFPTPMTIAAGERMITRCTYENTTAATVTSGTGTKEEMCFDFVYYHPPVDTVFCDQILDEDLVKSYEPGACAGGWDVPPLDPAPGVVKLVDALTLEYGGVEPEGRWMLTSLDMVLKSANTPVGAVDLEASAFESWAYLEVKGGVLLLDAFASGQLAVTAGAQLPYDIRVSAAGPWSLDVDGRVQIDPSCEEGDMPFRGLSLAKTEAGLAGILYLHMAQFNVDLAFDTRWAPVL